MVIAAITQHTPALYSTLSLESLPISFAMQKRGWRKSHPLIIVYCSFTKRCARYLRLGEYRNRYHLQKRLRPDRKRLR